MTLENDFGENALRRSVWGRKWRIRVVSVLDCFSRVVSARVDSANFRDESNV